MEQREPKLFAYQRSSDIASLKKNKIIDYKGDFWVNSFM